MTRISANQCLQYIQKSFHGDKSSSITTVSVEPWREKEPWRISIIWSLISSSDHTSQAIEYISFSCFTIRIPRHPLHLFGFMTKAFVFIFLSENLWSSCWLFIVKYVSAKGIPRLERKCFVLSLLSAREIDSSEFFVRIYRRFLAFIQRMPCEKNFILPIYKIRGVCQSLLIIIWFRFHILKAIFLTFLKKDLRKL